jgi:hypothetical protein
MRRQRKLKNFSISRRGPDNPKFELPDQGAQCPRYPPESRHREMPWRCANFKRILISE